MPKVELHRHLEGSLRPESVFGWLKEARYPLPTDDVDEFRRICQVLTPMSSLDAVLQRFEWVQRAFVSYDAVKSLTMEVCADAVRDNIRILELRFSPDFLTQPWRLDWDIAMESIVTGVDWAEKNLQMAIGLVVIATREFGFESVRRTVEFARRWRGHLVGFDLAGAEVTSSSDELRRLLEPIHESALGLTVHSGEATTANHVLSSVQTLGASRIGHGIRVVDDERIMEMLAGVGVAFEVCPTSNVRIGAARDYRDHPIGKMFQGGLTITVNSDDPGLFDITLTDEFYVLIEKGIFTINEVKQFNQNAYKKTFIPVSKKEGLPQSCWI
jgi:adenosine deaminase